jgi:glycine/D-amino acid oxidase-like deaminating enzyme
VNAAGAWAGKVAAMIGLDLPVDARPLHMNVTEPTDYFLPHLVQHAGVRLTMKQAARGNLIIGGGWPSEPPDEAGRLGVLRASVEGNLWVAQQAVPRLADLYLLRSWGSLIYRVPDICPVLGPGRRRPRFHTAVAVPNGYTLGPLCAEIVASLVGGTSHPLYHEGLGPDRYLQDQKADRPPSAAIVAPLIMRDSSEARNSAMLATSPGAPTENG